MKEVRKTAFLIEQQRTTRAPLPSLDKSAVSSTPRAELEGEGCVRGPCAVHPPSLRSPALACSPSPYSILLQWDAQGDAIGAGPWWSCRRGYSHPTSEMRTAGQEVWKELCSYWVTAVCSRRWAVIHLQSLNRLQGSGSYFSIKARSSRRRGM